MRKDSVIAGTGNRGNIYRLDSDHSYTRLLNLAAAQVTGFAAGAERPARTRSPATSAKFFPSVRNANRRARSKATSSTPARSPIGAA